MKNWLEEYRPITALEADESRNGIVETLEYFPIEILRRLRRDVNDVFTPNFITAMRDLIKNAQVVYWESSLWTAAVNGKEVFEGTVSKFQEVRPKMQLFIPSVDFTLDNTTVETLRLGRNNVLTALFLSNFDTSFEVSGIFNPNYEARKDVTLKNVEEFVPAFRFWHFEPGEIINTNVGMTTTALLEFMKQPFVGVDRITPPRAERRRLEKAKKTWPEVRQIVLRRAHKDYGKKKEATDWSCNWLVGAHWRDQYYPSKQEHHPKFINAYLKGPEDKPFKPPTRTIISVKR